MSFKAFHKPEENHEAWLMTYADFITLMAAFFVLIISVCEPKQEKLDAVVEGLTSGFMQDMIETPFKQLFQDFELIIEDNAVELQVAPTYTKQGVMLDIASSAIFNAGSTEIRADAIPMLKEVATSIQALKLKDYVIEVEGHTDDTPTAKGSHFTSNWELSALRSARIVRFFIEQGVAPEKMAVLGFANTRPKVPNLDNSGNPIPENREQNRRVIIQIKRLN
jgi:chemotaxis protein MotB